MVIDDLVTWLRGQLDEDERVARAATLGPWMWIAGRVSQERTAGRIVIPNPDGLAVSEAEDLAHIARHDPARVLAEVEAKRRILDLHQPVERIVAVGEGRSETWQCCVECSAPHELLDPPEATEWPCPTIQAMILPYADGPGYREEWRP